MGGNYFQKLKNHFKFFGKIHQFNCRIYLTNMKEVFNSNNMVGVGIDKDGEMATKGGVYKLFHSLQ